MGKVELSNVKRKILVVDDSELNRALLCDMLSDDYEILEAKNGLEASTVLREKEQEIALMLLDIVMPEMDGFELLAVMNKNGWTKSIPVIIISAEAVPSYVDRAYDLGAQDYISRPFNERIVQHRVSNTLMLFAKQQELENMVIEQIAKREKDNALMIEVLSSIVETRNGESGLHVRNIRILTELLLKKLLQKTDRYSIDRKEIPLICNASSLHDIGKIVIPTEILNKPGRLTDAEYEVMKTHSLEGAKLLEEILRRKKEPLIKTAYEICRWHHQRYDGRGYPDGLKGDEIPIVAQIVSMADVYDALRHERVYKKAYTHEKAMEMILAGECGVFNPLLLECLEELSDVLKKKLELSQGENITKTEIAWEIDRTFEKGSMDLSSRTFYLLERERMKYRFFANMSQEIQFEYTKTPEMLTLFEWGAEYLQLPEVILNPRESVFGREIFQEEDFVRFLQTLEDKNRKEDIYEGNYLLTIHGEKRWSRVMAQTIWSEEEPREFVGAIGKIVDVHNETEEIKPLKSLAERDSLTGLLNHKAARGKINRILAGGAELKYVMLLFDLDGFKMVNDKYGHLFGDEVLKFVASTLVENTRGADIVARVGGDEFLLFMPYEDEEKLPVDRMFRVLDKKFKGFPVSISMGVAKAKDSDGKYDTMFHMVDMALYKAKKMGKHAYCFYDKSDEVMKSVLSPIKDVDEAAEGER